MCTCLYTMDMSQKKSFYYKGVRTNIFGIPKIYEDNPRVKKDNRKKDFYLKTFASSFKKDSPKNLIIMYDIPHAHKKERDWLRRQLIKLDFIMIQKSVWVGPSPLPKEFLEYIKETNIQGNFKTFKLAKSFDIKKKL